MYRIVEALTKLARAAGVEFVFDTSVERINIAGESARGVMVNGQLLGV